MGVLRRKSPLFRRKSSRNVSAIEAEVDYVVQRSPFLLAAESGAQHEQQHDDDEAFMIAAFQRKEFQVGNLLGTGSFSKVHEIIGYKLSSNTRKKAKQQQQQLLKDPQLLNFSSTCSSECSFGGSSEALQEQMEASRIRLSMSAFDKTGKARYAVKFVKKELSKKSPHAFRNAAADLIVEARYLAALDHPNILKLRGTAKRGSAGFLDGHEGFFMIVDRLEETLSERIQQWQTSRPENLLAVQANYALQMANALAYLHDRRILFRDLKPTNVGFKADDPETVQLFDFGLCRELPPGTLDYTDDEDDEAFQMSGAGTYLYMAPEIINTKRYNLKADVYSWSFLFHEMIALERPFDSYTMEEHQEFVCEIGQRPSLTDFDMPESLQTLLKGAWEHAPAERLSMRQVCQQLQTILTKDLQQQLPEDISCLVPTAIPPPPRDEWTTARSNFSGRPSHTMKPLGLSRCFTK